MKSNRRKVLGVLLAMPMAHMPAPAQTAAQTPPRIHTIGILEIGSREDFAQDLARFKEGLREEGFAEGRNLVIEYRFADYDYSKMDRLAADLVRAKVQLIYAPTTWAVHGAQSATSRIPIVFSHVNDPVGTKFVQSLARPGGNITGVSTANGELTAKRVQLMRELFPAAGSLGVVFDEEAAKACQIELADIEKAGRQLGIGVSQFPYVKRSDLAGAFSRGQRMTVAAMLVPTTMETRRIGTELVVQSKGNKIPTIHASREPVDAGGLMSYGPDFGWATRRAANYVGRILNGAAPSDLPVEQPTRYELVINLKTARAMGVKIPQSLLLRADEVIQ